MIRFECDCGRQLQARDEDAGKKARCPSCDKVQTVPHESEVPSPATRDTDDEPRARPDSVRADRPGPRSRGRDRDHDDEEDDRIEREDDRPRRRKRPIDGSEQKSGKATAAMTLGLLTPCTAGLTGIPAVIFGCLALRDIGASDGRMAGRGMALTGIITAAVSYVLVIPIGLVIALMLPAVTKVRGAATRVNDANNFKQMALAMHNFSDVNGRLPQATAYRGKDGRPLLSWRVALLPYVEEDVLYRQFRLDEPWDSPHNMALVPRMPKVYQMPGQAYDGSGRTFYQVFVGERTLFEVPKALPGARPRGLGEPQLGLRFPMDVPDGLANTILIATARNPVIWTKPDDLIYDAIGSLPPLGGHFPSGFNVAFGDGSVRWIEQNTPDATLKAAITRNGGEAVTLP